MKSKNNSVPSTMGDVPPHVYSLIVEFLIGAGRDEVDLRKGHLRESMKKLFPFVIIMYAAIVVVGVVANIVVMVHVIWHKLWKDTTYAFIINNAVSDIVKCVFVLPITLYVLLVQNWMLGELLCSFLPMLQDIPLHVTTLTFVLTAWDRYRYVRNPNKPRLPAFVCAVGSWLTALCLVLPYPIYIIYVDLGRYSATFDGIGFCVVNLTDDMQEYMRGIFLIMYAGPLGTISYLYVKCSREMQTNATIVLYETRHRESRSRPTDSQRTSIDMRGSRGESDLLSQYSRNSYRNHQPGGYRPQVRHSLNADYSGENELDMARERRTNKYLASMVTVYAVCMCPLMVLRVARLALLETYENAGHFDITYTTFVWVGFLPTCTTPALFAAWHMSRPTRERLRGYFRISSRKTRRQCDTAETSCVSARSPPPPPHSPPPAAIDCSELNRSAARHLPPQPPHKPALQLELRTQHGGDSRHHHHQKQLQPQHQQPPPPQSRRYNSGVASVHQARHSSDNFDPHAAAAADFGYYPPPAHAVDELIEIHPDQHVLYAGHHQRMLSYPD